MSSRVTRRRFSGLALATSALFALTACGGDTSGSTDEAAGAGASAGSGAFPLSITNTFGDTEIEAQPERVATVNWGNHDVPLALGVMPVGIQKSSYGDDDGDGLLPWTAAAIEEIGGEAPVLFDETDGIPFEAVANTEPDVILAAYSGLTKEDYDTLTQIAPVVSYPTYAWGTSWQDMALIDGEALGLKDEAQAKVDQVTADIQTALGERPDIAGKTVAYTFLDPTDLSSVGVYTPLDARVQLVSDLGMEDAPSVVALAGDTEQFYVDLAAENADQLADVDIMVTYGDDTTLATLQADPLLSKIPAIARGSVVVLPNSAPISAATSGPTVLSVEWALTDYLDLFQAAAEKVG